MNVTIIYGNMQKDNTYNCVKLFLENLKLNSDISVTEFFLPNNLSDFGPKYFSCFINGKYTCHHFNSMLPIVTALDQSNLIILASPVNACDVSAQIKSLLNHLSCNFENYKFNSSITDKIGIVMCTTAGAGLYYSTKILKRNLKLLGIKKIFKFSKSIYELNWVDINIRNKQKINKQLSKLAYKITNLHNNIHYKTNRIFKPSYLPYVKNTENKKHCNIIEFPTQSNEKLIHSNTH